MDKKIINPNKVENSEKSVGKKKIGCLGCLGYILLILVIASIAFFIVRAVQNRIEEKEKQKLKARFDYTEKFSTEYKLSQAFEKGDISVDTYIMQLAYSIFDKDKLDTQFKSDNEVDFAPDIVDLLIRHKDEINQETAEYVAKNILLSDMRIHPDSIKNPIAYEERLLSPFFEYVFASEYDVTVLDKAMLSPSGKFLIWYTQSGKSAATDETIEELAKSVEDIVDKIEEFLDIDWDYKYTKINSSSYKSMKSVLDKCGIDEKVIDEALPIFVYDPPNKDGALAWYCKNIDSKLIPLLKLGNIFLDDDQKMEYSSVYSLPYIVIKTSSISNLETLHQLLAHELTHHFQRIYYNDLFYEACDFTSETVANFVAANIVNVKGTDNLLNHYANRYMEAVDSYLSRLESRTTSGYVEFVWAKSYVDFIENGKQYLKESLLEKNPYLFLCEKAGDSYQAVLEDLAVRNITKDYNEKSFISTVFPKEKGKIDRYIDNFNSIILANCFDYYYLETKTYRKSQTIIQIKNIGEKRIFIKIIGRKKDKYSLIETLYCESDNELLIADFSKNYYKKYDEIILAFGNCEPSGSANYKLCSLSPALVDLYETVSGLKNLNPWEISDDCLTIYIDDFVEGATTLTDYLIRRIKNINENINIELETEDAEDTEELETLSEYLYYLEDEINRIGEAIKKFKSIFDYKIMRFYKVEIENTELSDTELHDMALNTMPKLKFKIVDDMEDGYHITIGCGIQPFSDTQIILYQMITDSDGNATMYRVELEK